MRRSILLAIALAFGGCGWGTTSYVPVDADRASGSSTAAVSRIDGVTLIADAARWDHFPEDLERVMTPMYVEVRNDTQRPLAVRYADFRIVTDRGETYRAVPPLEIDREGPLRTNADLGGPLEPYQRFTFAPHYGPVYGPGVRYWDGAWEDGWGVGPYQAPSSWRPDLPTRPMIQHALPEGVLEPGGSVAGFLYFEKPDDDARRITLDATLAPPGPHQDAVAAFDIRFVPRG